MSGAKWMSVIPLKMTKSRHIKRISKMFVLDNDTLTHVLHGNAKINRRIEAVPPYDIWLPAIVIEEQFRGRLAILNRLDPKRKADSLELPQAYDLLLQTRRQLANYQVLQYTAQMEDLYQSWPAAVKRLGTRDCRIAATAIISGFTVITCNLSHFQTIPDAHIDDWNQ